MDDPATATRIRRPSVVAAPLLVVAVAAFGVAVVAGSWAAWDPANRVGSWWLWVVAPAAVGAVALALVRGCFVDVAAGEVRDVVAWRCRLRVPLSDVDGARVQRGVWRLFVLVRTDGSTVALIGSSPAQWPARLLATSRAQDVEDLRVLVGEPVGSGPPAPTT